MQIENRRMLPRTWMRHISTRTEDLFRETRHRKNITKKMMPERTTWHFRCFRHGTRDKSVCAQVSYTATPINRKQKCVIPQGCRSNTAHHLSMTPDRSCSPFSNTARPSQEQPMVKRYGIVCAGYARTWLRTPDAGFRL